MLRLWTIIRKEFIHIVRDVRTLSLIAFLPISMLVILGYAVSNDIENVPLVVADQALTKASRDLVDSLVNSRVFDVTAYVGSEEELLRCIDAGDAKAGVWIPTGYSAAGIRSDVVEIQFYIDGSDPSIAQVVQLAFQTIGQDHQFSMIMRGSQNSLDSPSISKEPSIRYLYNPDLRRLNFMIPALAASILQAQTLLLTGFAIVREREIGTLEQLIVTPIQPWELLLGKIIPFVLIGFANLWITLGLGSFWFHVPLSGSMPLLAGLSLLFILGSLGLGILISVAARSQIQAMHIAMFINLPSLVLSGFIFPRYNMPAGAFYAGYLLPLTYFVEIIRGIALKGVGLSQLWGAVIPLAMFSVGVFTAGLLLFRKRLE